MGSRPPNSMQNALYVAGRHILPKQRWFTCCPPAKGRVAPKVISA